MNTTFSDHQYEMCYPPGIEHYWWNIARNRLLAEILKRESDKSSVYLEVGCGKGVVVKGLRDHGFNIFGVELADIEPIEGMQPYVDSDTDACNWAIERRSEITGLLLLDVIEHLPEPEKFLAKLEQTFPNLAVVIITVPARQELWSNYDTFYGHHRRYSLETLEQLSKDLNWTTKKAGYFFHTPYLPGRLMSLLGINRDTKIHSPKKAMRPLHRLLSSVFNLERKIVPQTVRGTSAYAVYRPKKAEQS